MRLSRLLLALSLAAAACGGSSKPATAPAAAAPAPTLYQRLGGQPAIEAVVDGFLANVVADARINKFFAGKLGRLLAQLHESIWASAA